MEGWSWRGGVRGRERGWGRDRIRDTERLRFGSKEG
jgi:hypothetical protein